MPFLNRSEEEKIEEERKERREDGRRREERKEEKMRGAKMREEKRHPGQPPDPHRDKDGIQNMCFYNSLQKRYICGHAGSRS